MVSLTTIIAITIAYFIALFLVAVYVERKYAKGKNLTDNALVYTLSLAVYATAWTFFGNVGLATSSSYAFLGIYTGPALLMLFAWPLLRKLVKIRNEYGVASISGLLSARYDHSYVVGAVAALIALFGITPYFALQFKAIFLSFSFIVSGGTQYDSDVIRWIMVGMTILFTLVFGFRRLEQTERHPGMVIVVAIQSVIKLVAFLAAGIFVTYMLFDGFGDIFAQINDNKELLGAIAASKPSLSLFLSYIFIGMFAFLLLPRDFHMAVVENSNEKHIKTLAWGMPLYMFLITLFVFPIAMAGILKEYDIASADVFILFVTALAKYTWLTVLVFIGGLSAAFSMIMVETVAITTMVANNLVLPLVDKVRLFGFLRKHLLPMRWMIAVAILLMGYAFEVVTGSSYVLVKIGIISFVAVLQLAPAAIGGLFWEKGNKMGAIMGLSGGFAVWLYTSLVPAFARSGWFSNTLLTEGPYGIGWLRPENLFGVTLIDPLATTIIFTLIVNGGLYIMGSLLCKQSEEEQRAAYNIVHIVRGGRHRVVDVQQKEYIDIEAKRKTIQSVFGNYMGATQAKEQTSECIRNVGLEEKKVISINELIDLNNAVEGALSGFIGNPAARDALEKETLFSPEEAAQLSNVYAKMAADIKITPEEFAQKIAEQKLLAQAKTIFMAIASHEMRTPLSIIRGNAELLLQEIEPTKKNEETIKFLTGIRRNSIRLLDILHDFIDVMHMEDSKVELNKEVFGPEKMVHEIVSDFGSITAEKNLSIQFKEPEHPIPMIWADVDKTRQVIVNLIGNAVHYTEKGGITVVVDVVSEPNGRFIKICVIDTGVGISSESQAMLFQKFSTITKTFLRTKEYGSGLGLYISKTFVEAMGGSIRLEKSEPGKGSTFCVLLPEATGKVKQ
ncbi:TPA: hypothetical protein DCS99_03890 [Candidatus Wolfebacteria bacterium]|nr:hypothetical protein [Candidatus Wolfebacteria bacterium]